MDADERTYRVDLMTRVEGEGRFLLRVRDGVVERAELSIFEAPRFFEALLRGRSIDEVPDIELWETLRRSDGGAICWRSAVILRARFATLRRAIAMVAASRSRTTIRNPPGGPGSTPSPSA